MKSAAGGALNGLPCRQLLTDDAGINRCNGVIVLGALRYRFHTIDTLADLSAELDFTVGLTAAERQALPRMSDGTEPFVRDALTGARQNPDLFPGYVKLDELEKDTTLYTPLGPLVTRVMQLGELLLDT